MKTREQLIAEAERQSEEIAQYFRDVEHWNANRGKEEGEIDPDPDGSMQEMARTLTEFLSKNKTASKTAAKELSFEELRRKNVLRCEDVFHPLNDWSATDWACAMAGECGEVCNKVKKLRRGEMITRKDIGEELADVIIYADLLAARMGIELGEEVVAKFNKVSAKRESSITL